MGLVRITARVDYAVRAALELAAVAPEALTCDRIATAQGIPAGYRLALPPSEISIARVMRVEQGFLAEVHGKRPEDVEYPGNAEALASVWVAAREAYRRVLEEVTLADVVAGKLPEHAAGLVAMDEAWHSFGDSAS
jgi:DNA-binding IscR family transcriptional regulator